MKSEIRSLVVTLTLTIGLITGSAVWADAAYGLSDPTSSPPATLSSNPTSTITATATAAPTSTPKPTPTPKPKPTLSISNKAEAENGILNGTNIANSISGYSGSGYVTGFDKTGDSMAVRVTVTKPATCKVSIRYSAPYGDKSNTLYVNDKKITQKKFSQSSGFTTTSINVYLTSGVNTIKIENSKGDNGWICVDYIEVK